MSDYNNNANMGAEIGWDDEISQESNFVLLEPGDYDFTVASFERKRFNGSEKMCACNQVVLRIDVGEGTIFDNLYMNTKAEWRISQFFKAIGQKQSGVPFVPNWNAVPGSSGRCKVGIHKWKDNDGEERKYNEIKEYYEPDSNAPVRQTAPASYQQTTVNGYANQAANGRPGHWQPGKF